MDADGLQGLMGVGALFRGDRDKRGRRSWRDGAAGQRMRRSRWETGMAARSDMRSLSHGKPPPGRLSGQRGRIQA